jgi:hypothetical protein
MGMGTYQVVLEGRTLGGRAANEVATNLGKLFKLPSERFVSLLEGSPTVLKRGVDEDVAARYQVALERAGAACRIEKINAPADTPASEDIGNAEARSAVEMEPSVTSGKPSPPSELRKDTERERTAQVPVRLGRVVLVLAGIAALAYLVHGYLQEQPEANQSGSLTRRPIPIPDRPVRVASAQGDFRCVASTGERFGFITQGGGALIWSGKIPPGLETSTHWTLSRGDRFSFGDNQGGWTELLITAFTEQTADLRDEWSRTYHCVRN